MASFLHQLIQLLLRLVRCLWLGRLDRIGRGDAAVRGESKGQLLLPLGEEGLRVPGERRRVGVVEVERLNPYRVGRGAVQRDSQPDLRQDAGSASRRPRSRKANGWSGG